MENSPEAPVTPEVKSEATPNTNPEPAKTQEAPAAPDMHGFTSEQLADMQKFFQANGGYDKVKSRISNPTPAPVQEQKPVEPAQTAAAPQEQEYKAPAGAVNQNEWFIKDYFEKLADRKYNNISEYIYSGKALTDMAELGIQYLLPNGAIDGDKVNKFLTMKSQTAPAKQTGVSPEASAAPTVDYIPVGDTIKNEAEARAVIMQDLQLKRSGQAGHPSVQKAEEFLRNLLSKGSK